MTLLASQYAKRGHYDIEEHQATILNGIIILDTGHWFENFADLYDAGDEKERITS